MTAKIGRKVVWKWNGIRIPGVREKGIAINGEPIDITDDEDDGVRQLLDEAAELTWEISISGITKSDVLKIAAAAKTDRIKPNTLEYPNGSIVTGSFYLSNYNEGNPYKEATTFDVTLVSSGPVILTPAP